MEHIEIDKARMDALRALSDTNMEVSRARETLSILKKDEAGYLEEREKKVIQHVHKALEDSEDIIKKTIQNYELVKDFAVSVSEAGKAIGEAVEEITKYSEVHEERISAWEARCKEQDNWIAEQKKVIQLSNVLLNSEKESIERQKKLLADGNRRLASDRATLERAIKRLKEGRI